MSKNKYYRSGISIAVCLLGIALFVPFTQASHSLADSKVSRRPALSTVSLNYQSSENSAHFVDQPIQTTGCGKPLDIKTGTTTDVSMTSDHQARNYLVYLPSNYSNTTSHAVVLDFHGYNQDASIQEATSKLNPIASANNFISVYPDGSYGTTGKRGWDTGLHPGITANDTLFVSNVLNQLQTNFCVQPTQIYATGLSNGGGFVNLLACDLSDRIAAFAPVSGSYVTPAKDCHVSQAVSIIEFHGTADRVNPYAGAVIKREPPVMTWINQWLARDNCSKTPSTQAANSVTTVYTWNACNDQATITHYKIAGGQHVWPNQLFKQTINGKTQNVDAANVIWQFFASHPLRTTS